MSPVTSAGSPNRLRILVLEDNPADVELMLRALQHDGIDHEAEIVDDAHAFVAALAGNPDVIISDYNLPTFDALGALRYVRESGRDIPLIVVSGALADEEATESIRAGAADYLLKDRLARLGSAVIRAVEARQLRLANQLSVAGLRETSQRLQAIFDNTADGIVTVSPDGRVDASNTAAQRLFGYSADELKGMAVRSLVSDAHVPELDPSEADGAVAAVHSPPRVRECSGLRKGGSGVPVELRAERIPVLDGEVMVVIFRDITERKAYVSALEHQALHDVLTGLPNRALFVDVLNRAIHVGARDRGRVVMLLLGVTGFKDLNESYGHQVGDELLLEVAARLHETLRASDTAARLEGDEFGILPHGSLTDEQLEQVTRKVLAIFDREFALRGHRLHAAGRVGVAIYPDHATDTAALLRCADIAMYGAGREGVKSLWYNRELDHYGADRLKLMSELHEAIDGDQLVLYYQPKIDLQAGHATGVEALLRWNHPERGLLPPAAFIDAAEANDVIVPLTRWVVGESFRQLAEWNQRGLGLKMQLNLSARNLVDPEEIEEMARMLKRHDVSASQIAMEITERNFASARAQESLLALRAHGFGISVDDFGTGYSALSYLRDMPATEIKIDRSFISAMVADRGAIVSPVIQMAHNLGLSVVAEGIEELETAQSLRLLGCDSGQGYHFGRPMPAEALEAWARQQGAGHGAG
ncbi:MAG TPA: EAL domain-containing protein [Candidatus Dormibacteraeota bacterium]|jgi:diguanylate cyclase (GGDEF)-like protein/PAS domain S-box-containing protein